MAQLGDVLTAPEAGWKSYSDSEIEAIKNKIINSDPGYYRFVYYLTQSQIDSNSNYIIKVPVICDLYSNTSNNYNSFMSFKITGDKIRIISIYEERAVLYKEKIWFPSISVYIDGKYEGQILHNNSKVGSTTDFHYNTLCFEKTNLENKEHFVAIIANSSSYDSANSPIIVNIPISALMQTVHVSENGNLLDYNHKKSFIEDSFIELYKKNLFINKKYIDSKFLFMNPTSYTTSQTFFDINFPIRSYGKLSNTDNLDYSLNTHYLNNLIVDDINLRFEVKGIRDNTGTIQDITKQQSLYDISNYAIHFNPFKQFSSTVDEDGFRISETINLNTDFKETITFNTDSLTAEVIPNDIILQTTHPFSLSNIDIIRGISYIKSQDDVFAKFLVSPNGETFYTYNTETNDWEECTINNISEKGIETFDSITTEKWTSLFNTTWKLHLMMLVGINVPEDTNTYDTTIERYIKDITINQGREYDRPETILSEKSYNLTFKYTYTDEDNNRHYISMQTVDKERIPTEAILKSTFTSITGGEFVPESKQYPRGWFRLISDTEFKQYVLTDRDFGYSKLSKEYVWDSTKNTVGTVQYDENETCDDTRLRFEFVVADPELVSRNNSETKLPVVLDVTKAKKGQAVPCCYTATAQTVGTFKFGYNNKNIIPDLGSIEPDGYFNFICVDEYNGKKIFIADRNVQSKISWETLNESNLCTNSGMKIDVPKAISAIVRIPATISEKITNRTQYGEWDKYISYYGQNGITPSDNEVWNTRSTNSWTMTNPYNEDSTELNKILSNRIIRGYQDKNIPSQYNQRNIVSTTLDETLGFRPVLEVEVQKDIDEIVTQPECNLRLAESFVDCNIGEAITCEYTVDIDSPGTVGTFKINNASTKPLISVPAEEVPDGKFYFVCVDEYNGKKIFIADRNVQSKISWETLNESNLCTNSGTDYESLTKIKNSIMRLPLSNVLNYDMDLSSSEWDTYLMKEEIGTSKVSASKCNYWNMRRTSSWCINNPSLEEKDFGGTVPTVTDRNIRGVEKIDYSLSPRTFIKSDLKFNSLGFRPVLEVDLSSITIIMKNFKINTTHVNDMNPMNKNVMVRGTYAYLKKDESIYKSTEFKVTLNDVEFASDRITMNPDHSFNFDIPVGELVVGDNTLKIEVTTVDKTDVEMVNKFLYKIDLEDNDNLRKTVTKTRDYKTYTDGFEMNSLEISGNQVINSNKFVSEKNVTSVTIPENTISISIKEV